MARSSCILESPSAADRPHCGETVSGGKGGKGWKNRIFDFSNNEKSKKKNDYYLTAVRVLSEGSQGV